MKRATLLLLLLALVARADEEKPEAPKAAPPKDPPGCLRPGAKATYRRAAGEGHLRGTVDYAVEAGDQADTVRIVWNFRTDTTGPLAVRERLVAVLDVKAGRLLSFVFEAGTTGDLRLAARLAPDPKKEGRWRHERFKYSRPGDEPVATKRYPKILDGRWSPERIEPFLAAVPGTDSIALMDALTGRISKSTATYAELGKGEKLLGEESVPSVIISRKRGGSMSLVYLRAADRMLLAGGGLEIRSGKEGGR